MDGQGRHPAKAGRSTSCSSAPATLSRCINPLLAGGGGGGGGSGGPGGTGHPNNQVLKCPRCDSFNTKFCYYNNYSLLQPRHFCKNCRRYWTKGGALRNVPVGGGFRKSKRTPSSGGAAGPSPMKSCSTAAVMLTSPAPPKQVLNVMMTGNPASCTTGTTHLIDPVQTRPPYFSDLSLQPSAAAAAALQTSLSPTTNTYYKLYAASSSKTGLIQPSLINPTFSISPRVSSYSYSSPPLATNPCFSSILSHINSPESLDTPINQPALPTNMLTTTLYRSTPAGSSTVLGRHTNEINVNVGAYMQRIMAVTSSSAPSTTDHTMTNHAGNILNSWAVAMNEGTLTQPVCNPDQWNSRGTLMQTQESNVKEVGSLPASSQILWPPSTKMELVSDNFNNTKGSCFSEAASVAMSGSSWPVEEGTDDHAAAAAAAADDAFLEPSVAAEETTYWNCNPSTTWPNDN